VHGRSFARTFSASAGEIRLADRLAIPTGPMTGISALLKSVSSSKGPQDPPTQLDAAFTAPHSWSNLGCRHTDNRVSRRLHWHQHLGTRFRSALQSTRVDRNDRAVTSTRNVGPRCRQQLTRLDVQSGGLTHRVEVTSSQTRQQACIRTANAGWEASRSGRVGSQRQHPFSPREPMTKTT